MLVVLSKRLSQLKILDQYSYHQPHEQENEGLYNLKPAQGSGLIAQVKMFLVQ